jgi:carboxymethylenebutenolidase
LDTKTGDLKLDVGGQPAFAYLAAPERGGPGLLVLHAWWGFKPFIKQVCDRLAAEGFTALAPDLYQGRTAQTIDEAEALLKLRDIELMEGTLQAAMRKLGSITGGKLGVMGFSMGASWALLTAANEPEVAAVVLFYGTEGVDFNEIKAAVQGHFAEMDPYEPLEGVRAMEADMKAAGLQADFHIYPEAHHWFMEEDRPEYDRAQAEAAWRQTIDFLHGQLG